MSEHSILESLAMRFSEYGGKHHLLLGSAALTLAICAVLYWTRFGSRRLVLKCLAVALLLHLLVGGIAHEYHLYLRQESEASIASLQEERIPIQLAPEVAVLNDSGRLRPIDDPRDLASALDVPLESERRHLEPEELAPTRLPIDQRNDEQPPQEPLALPKIEDQPGSTLATAAPSAVPLTPDIEAVPDAPKIASTTQESILPADEVAMVRRPAASSALNLPLAQRPMPRREEPDFAAPTLDAPKNSQGAEVADPVLEELPGLADLDAPLDPIAPPLLPQETPVAELEQSSDTKGLNIRADEEGMLGRRSRPMAQTLPRRSATASPAKALDGPDDLALTRLAAGAGAPQLDRPLGANEAASAMTAVWRNRRAPNRMGIVERFGGSLRTEQAVDDALAWLAAHQSASGNWDCDRFFDACPPDDPCEGSAIETGSDAGVTALALLTFLGAGHTHQEDGRYRETIDRGLTWLRSIQRPDGDLRLTGRIYCHAMATLCLCEAYAMTGDPLLKDAAQKGIRWLSQAQHQQSGGWRYGPGQFGDTSVYGWAVLALRSARNAGLEVSEQTWSRSQRWLTLVSSGARGGLACYRPGTAPTHAMTAEALVCRQIFGMPKSHPGMAEAGDYLLSRLPDTGDYHLYYWYYGTLAMFQLGGEHWTRWNQTLTSTLLATQNQKGHQRGSWDPESPFGVDGGRVFATACSALCLEVYYRYLPLYSDSGTAKPQENNGN